jgi:YfiH family protein
VFTIGNLQLRDDAGEWDAVAGEMGVTRERLCLLRQVHGNGVVVLQRASGAECGMPEADAIVSDDPDRACAVRVADCAPILLADTRTGAVGAAHAGWRGTVHSVAVAAVRAMQSEFGSRPADLLAAIGPCLGACCGEVGDEVVDAFRQAGHSEAALRAWFSPGPRRRPMLDLWKANGDQLAGAGLAPGNIHVAELCTKTHTPLMHSYRASGNAAGRMVGAIKAGIGRGPGAGAGA